MLSAFKKSITPKLPALRARFTHFIADTVEITEEGGKLLTSELKSLSQISYSIKSEQEQRDARKTRAAQVASESAGTRPRLRTQQRLTGC